MRTSFGNFTKVGLFVLGLSGICGNNAEASQVKLNAVLNTAFSSTSLTAILNPIFGTNNFAEKVSESVEFKYAGLDETFQVQQSGPNVDLAVLPFFSGNSEYLSLAYGLYASNTKHSGDGSYSIDTLSEGASLVLKLDPIQPFSRSYQISDVGFNVEVLDFYSDLYSQAGQKLVSFSASAQGPFTSARISLSVVPLPASVWMFGASLVALGIVGLGAKLKRGAAEA